MIEIRCFNCGTQIGKTQLKTEELYKRTVLKNKPFLCTLLKCQK